MPCVDGRDHEDRERARQELDRVTDLLCQVGRAFYRRDVIPMEVLAWWAAHAERDAARGKPWQVADND